jgi:hypothetical protein
MVLQDYTMHPENVQELVQVVIRESASSGNAQRWGRKETSIEQCSGFKVHGRPQVLALATDAAFPSLEIKGPCVVLAAPLVTPSFSS